LRSAQPTPFLASRDHDSSLSAVPYSARGSNEPSQTHDRRSRDHATNTDASGNTVRSCTDYDGDQGATYAYVVKRKDTCGRWSVASREILVTRPGDEIAPPAVPNLTAQALEYGVKLDWDPNPVQDLAEYRIYEQSHPSQHPGYLRTVDATKSETLLRMPADGEQRHYVVIPVDRYGNAATFIGDPEGDGTHWSDPVSTVSVTELDLRPTTGAPRPRRAIWAHSSTSRATSRWTRTALARPSSRPTATTSTAGTARRTPGSV
jgi:hypothetical protein